MSIFPEGSSNTALIIEVWRNESPSERVMNCFGHRAVDAGQSLSPNPPASMTISVIVSVLCFYKPFCFNLIVLDGLLLLTIH